MIRIRLQFGQLRLQNIVFLYELHVRSNVFEGLRKDGCYSHVTQLVDNIETILQGEKLPNTCIEHLCEFRLKDITRSSPVRIPFQDQLGVHFFAFGEVVVDMFECKQFGFKQEIVQMVACKAHTILVLVFVLVFVVIVIVFVVVFVVVFIFVCAFVYNSKQDREPVGNVLLPLDFSRDESLAFFPSSLFRRGCLFHGRQVRTSEKRKREGLSNALSFKDL